MKKSNYDYDIALIKTNDVIMSCKTHEQFDSVVKYLELWSNRYKNKSDNFIEDRMALLKTLDIVSLRVNH